MLYVQSIFSQLQTNAQTPRKPNSHYRSFTIWVCDIFAPLQLRLYGCAMCCFPVEVYRRIVCWLGRPTKTSDFKDRGATTIDEPFFYILDARTLLTRQRRATQLEYITHIAHGRCPKHHQCCAVCVCGNQLGSFIFSRTSSPIRSVFARRNFIVYADIAARGLAVSTRCINNTQRYKHTHTHTSLGRYSYTP